MKSIIEAMYNGNTLPLMEVHLLRKECNQKADEFMGFEKKILQKYPKAKKLFEKYSDAQSEYIDMYSYQQFLLGMRMGAQIIIELLEPIEK